MRIGFDARLIGETGVGRYIKNLLSELKEIDSENEYFIFLNGRYFDDFTLPSRKWHKVKVDIRWHSLKEQLQMPKILNKYHLDFVHFPYFNVPVFYLGKYVLTVHDLIIDHFPTGRASTLNPVKYYLKWLTYRIVMGMALFRASKIFSISNSTKSEIISHYGIAPQKIIITYDALDRNLIKLKKKYKPKKTFNFSYLLYIGNAYPHKNLENLIRAFQNPDINSRAKLILAGDDGFFYQRLKKLVKEYNLNKQILFFGKADDKELIDLYSNARGLITPSLMEGFGLPNFEAVFFDILPVVSDIPVFRELWKKNLIYFNPEKNSEIQNIIIEFLNLKEEKIKTMISKAKLRLNLFSWKDSAGKTLVQYKKINDKIDI